MQGAAKNRRVFRTGSGRFPGAEGGTPGGFGQDGYRRNLAKETRRKGGAAWGRPGCGRRRGSSRVSDAEHAGESSLDSVTQTLKGTFPRSMS